MFDNGLAEIIATGGILGALTLTPMLTKSLQSPSSSCTLKVTI